jgi:hypothetical protein
MWGCVVEDMKGGGAHQVRRDQQGALCDLLYRAPPHRPQLLQGDDPVDLAVHLL